MDKAERAEMQEMVTKAGQEIETKLAISMASVIEDITKKIALAVDLNKQSKAAFETVPGLIQEQIESQLKANLTGIVEEVGKQFEGKMKEKLAGGGGNSGEGGHGMSLAYLLDNSDKVIGIMNAWKQPTTEVAMLGQMNLVFKWHALLSKLEKGGGSTDEVTKTIADIFTGK